MATEVSVHGVTKTKKTFTLATGVDATLTEKKNLFLGILCKKYWKMIKLQKKSGESLTVRKVEP